MLVERKRDREQEQEQKMIEFELHFREPKGTPHASAYFRPSDVEVVLHDVAQMSDQEWDQRRQAVLSQTHDHWPQAYAKTKLATRLQKELVIDEAMFAFGALHVLVPPAAEARALENNHQALRDRFTAKVYRDGLGNRLRVVGSVAPGTEAGAAAELFDKRWLHRLQVRVIQNNQVTFREDYFVVPFHVPAIGSDELSPEAQALKARIPYEPGD